MYYRGVVESRNDPLMLGRCKVRIVGLHTENKILLPTDDLPWAFPLMPINGGSISGLGWSPTGVVPGSWVLCIFLDEDKQQPIMLGTIGGIPSTKTMSAILDTTDSIVVTDDTGEFIDQAGNVVTDLINTIIDPSIPISKSTTKYKLIDDGQGAIKIIDKNNNVIGKVTYDANTKLYSTTLVNPTNFTKEQSSPFMGNTPKTFKSKDEVSSYFEKNF